MEGLSVSKKHNGKYHNPAYWSGLLWKIVRSVLILGLSYLILYPFVIKFLNSLKSFDDFMDPAVRFIARDFQWGNIADTYQAMGYSTAFMNTFFLSIACGILQMVFCTLIGYGFGRFRFKGNTFWFLCVLLTLIVPPQTIMGPLFMRFRFFAGVLNTINTVAPVLVLSVTGLGLRNGFYIFILRQFFRNMPKELEEAAEIDGCKSLQIFYKIMIPAAIPMLVTVFLFAFSWQWTDTFYNSLLMGKIETLTSAISKVAILSSEPVMQSMFRNTAALLAIVPLAIIYIAAQKMFVQSIERSGIVG